MDIHKNDKGISVGDKVFYMVNGWIPVPCTIVGKQGQGMTRVFVFEMDERSTGGRTLGNPNYPSDNEWQYRFTSKPNNARPR